ncbi:hypothetical protein PFISCL1PPCAC_23068, partial [Pristionchus fissidentatus]
AAAAAAASVATSSNGREEIPLSISLTFFTIALCIIILGVLGNAFVVAVIVTDRKLLHSSVNLFLLNLALADMGNLIFCTPDVVIAIFDLPWLLPEVLCPTFRFLQEYFLYASVLLQMSIGIERFMAICTPLQMQRFSRRTTIFFLFCAWLVAALFALPGGIYQRAHVPTYRNTTIPIPPGRLICHPKQFPIKVKGVVEAINFAVLYCIPLVLLTVLYFIMCRRLWGKECMIAGESQQMAILRLRRSVVKMLVISMLIYFICYTPIQSIHFLQGRLHFPIPVRLTINMMALASSAANPIVYIMCCRHFHQRFVAMANKALRCCPRSPEKYQTVITDGDKIDAAPEVDALGDAALGLDYGRQLRRVAPGGARRSYGANSAPSCSPPSPSLCASPASRRAHARDSTSSSTSFVWSAVRRLSRAREARKSATATMITVD